MRVSPVTLSSLIGRISSSTAQCDCVGLGLFDHGVRAHCAHHYGFTHRVDRSAAPEYGAFARGPDGSDQRGRGCRLGRPGSAGADRGANRRVEQGGKFRLRLVSWHEPTETVVLTRRGVKINLAESRRERWRGTEQPVRGHMSAPGQAEHPIVHRQPSPSSHAAQHLGPGRHRSCARPLRHAA